MNFIFNYLERITESINKFYSMNLFKKIESFFNQTLNYSSLLVLILGFLIGLTLAIKSNTFNYFLYSICWIIISSCLFYLNKIIIGILSNYIDKNSIQLTNTDYWKFIYGPLMTFLIIIFFLGTFIYGLQFKIYLPLIVFFIILIPIVVSQIIFINPELSNVNINLNHTIGQDYISLIKFNTVTYFIKSTKIYYAYLSVLALFVMLKFLLDIISGNQFNLTSTNLLIVPIFLLYPFMILVYVYFTSFFIEIFENLLSLKK